MAQLKITADNMLVAEPASGEPAHVGNLTQSYDSGSSISSDPEPLGSDLPDGTFQAREALVEAIRVAGHEVVAEPASREGAGH